MTGNPKEGEVEMLRFCLFDSERIGEVYARIIGQHKDAELVAVVSTNRGTASELTSRYGGQVFQSFTDCLGAVEVDAAITGSPTSMHLEIITEVAQAGKAILCEKPIDVSIERVDQCIAVLEQHATPFAVGFNRRFDPTITALRNQVMQGDVEKINMLLLTSRNPALPPIDYIKCSGDYFCDSTIHGIDLACWITDDRPVEVFASASCLVDKQIGEASDVEIAMTTLKMSSGVLCHINNSRQALEVA
jgi:myo-inositol 2-dehydrogenase/D-chiro-inositol 1-dehydrogenase